MFNRKILVAFAALGVLAGSNAFASRAHEVVMGSGDGKTILNGGSFYYDDNRNIFYNPAYINDFKNWATIEKSNYPGNTAEGGFVTALSNVNVGVYFNRGDAFTVFPGLATTNGGGGVGPGEAKYLSGTNPLRPIELLVGGDMGVKWGLGLTYAHSARPATAGSQSATGNQGYFAANVGASVANFEPFFGIQLLGQDLVKDHKQQFVRGGVKYHWGEWTPYAAILATSYKDEVDATNITKRSGVNYGLGLGRSAKIAEGTRLNYAVSYWHVSEKMTTAAAAEDDTKYTRNIVPVDMSVEGDVASWLTLRAGLGFRVWDSIGGPHAMDAADGTTGRLGAGMHFGKVDFDFAVGGALGTALTNGEANAGVDAQYFGLGNGLFTAASATYHW